ncbi:MAG: glutathione S-transferase family protein [Sphingomonadales bacterium]|nr:glutathione S-transferase family protein [Sphingomonadales bacterium]MBU3993557.1 glutathione S-transferase family protein [Alphaproteobacteria bacterium]
MIDFYGTGSPNVFKVAIMLEEAGLEYRTHYVGVLNGDNFTPEFLALNPIAKVPVIIDHAGAGPDQPIFESGAILIYLAETYLPELLPAAGHDRWEILKWLMFQMSLVGPMLGQVNHFQLIPSESDGYAAGRYRDQATRAYRIIDDRLKVSRFIAGDKYSIADIAVHPWMGYLKRHGLEEQDFPHLIAWRELLDERAAVKRGSAAIAEMASKAPQSPAATTSATLDGFFARRAPGPQVDLASYAKRGPMFTAVADKNAKD